MLLYSLLFLSGYELTLEDLKQFRQWGSATPGHPENHMTPGVEMATGPLGQGISTAVGMALAEKFLSAKFNQPGREIVDHRTFVIASDGDLMEGVSNEACSLAGHLELGKLIVLYDDNQITIDGETNLSFSENVEERYRALGWGVWRCDGMDVDAVDKCLESALKDTVRPSLIMCRTTIGYGSPHKAGKSSSHGAPLGAEEVLETKKILGIPEQEFWIDDEVLRAYRESVTKGDDWERTWKSELAEYTSQNPELGPLLRSVLFDGVVLDWAKILPNFETDGATRDQSQAVINALAQTMPTLLSGCADLAESVKTHIHDGGHFSVQNPTGRNIAFGIREHAMAAIVNGMTLHGGVRSFGGTFLIFSDYCRPALRLAALMQCPSIFAFSHDSIGLGEDGPTHQPIEQLMSMRMIPNFNVMRPADGNETAACWKIAIESKSTPSVIVLSRQKLPIVTPGIVAKHPAERGAYVLREASGSNPKLILVATGSEVSLAIKAGEVLEASGIPTRVISMPSWFLFEKQPESYKMTIFLEGIPRVSVEAGTTLGWSRYADRCVGIDHFGASAPADILFKEFGFTVENVVSHCQELLGK